MNRVYVGISNDVISRLKRHNANAVKSTKNKGPWRIIYTEKCINLEQARLREKYLKSYKGSLEKRKIINSTTQSGVV